ncbi:hypothetical protein Pelo_19558 [Pelomyxa schiedti]|nr:hypothetical protein Pelo_19558 [Pelomyxa schiedti]
MSETDYNSLISKIAVDNAERLLLEIKEFTIDDGRATKLSQALVMNKTLLVLGLENWQNPQETESVMGKLQF